MARDEVGETLDANARWLNANPNQLVLIEDHCDQRGTNEYNLALGEGRAKAALNQQHGQLGQMRYLTTRVLGDKFCPPAPTVCRQGPGEGREDGLMSRSDQDGTSAPELAEPDAPRVIIMTLHEEYRPLGRAAGGDG